VVQQMRASQAAAAAAGSNTGAGGSGETPQPPPPAQVQAQPAVSNNMPEDVVPPTVPAPISAPTEEQKPPVSNQQAPIQFTQTRGAAGAFPSGNPDVAAQMKKLINKTGIQPQPFSGSPTPRAAPPPAPVPITQPQPQPQQASTSSGGPKQWEGSFVVNAASQQASGFEVQLAIVQCTGDLYVLDRSLWSSINLFR
jgi:mediator of RNA polymerase II transcription subunit 25